MLSKGKKLFPKASYLGVRIMHIFSLKRCLFCFVFIYFYSLFEFFIHIIFYIYVVIFSILCFESLKVVKEM